WGVGRGNVVERHDTAVAHERCVELKVVLHSLIAVISIDEEEVDRSAVQKRFERRHGTRIVGVTPEKQVDTLVLALEAAAHERVRRQRPEPSERARVDRDQPRVRRGDPRPEKERSAYAGPDLDEDARLERTSPSEKPEDLLVGLPRPHVAGPPTVRTGEVERFVVAHCRQPPERPAGAEGVVVGPEPIEDHDGIGIRARLAAAARTRRIRAPDRYLGYIVSTFRILPL